MKYAHSVFFNGKFYPCGVEIPRKETMKAVEKDTEKIEKPAEVEKVVAEDKEVKEVKTSKKTAKRK